MARVVRPLLAYAVVVAAGIVASHAVLGPLDVGLDAGPLFGEWRVPAHPERLLLPLAVGAGVVWRGPTLAAGLRWPLVPVASGLGAAAWGVALALTEGWDRLTSPTTTRFEYERFAATIEDPGAFLRHFTDDLTPYPVHVQGHPPGAPLVPRALDGLGLPGAGWLAALLIVSWGVAAAAVLVGVRAAGSEQAARRAAPAVVLLPAAIWAVTSMDALFAATFAVGIALVLQRRRSLVAAGGAVLGGGLLGTYGGVLLVGVALAVLAWRRRWLDAVIAGGAAVGVLVAVWALWGFWWVDGLEATRQAYWAGIASRRPSAFLTAVGNPTSLALALGPTAAVGFVRALPAWRAHLLPVTAGAAVLLADLSLLSKGEVERIWLPFAVWMAAAAPGDDRRWLAVQCAFAVALQALLRTAW